MAPTQSFEHHARFFPLFHFFVLPILAANVVWMSLRLWERPIGDNVMGALVAIALVALALSARVMALAVQDRVIRLEMRLRLREVLPADLQPRIAELTVKQLVALRFASDGEMSDLVRRVLDGKIANPRAIKEQIRNWQSDFQRA